MPGVSITITTTGSPGSSSAAKEELRYGPDYREEILLRDEFSEIMVTTHQNYPYWQYGNWENGSLHGCAWVTFRPDRRIRRHGPRFFAASADNDT